MSLTSFSDESRPLLEVHAAPADAGADARTATNYRARAYAWVLAATVLRFALLAPIPLGNGEAYYYSWSRFLDWSYYDHPPLVAWMARLTTMLGASPAAVHLGPVLASGAFGLLFYRLAERLFRPRAAFFALVMVTAMPVFLATSFILNPEAPLAPLWVGFLLVVWRMRDEDDPRLPIAAGALLGLAFLAKYTAVLLVPGVLLYMAASLPARRWLRRPSFYAGGALAMFIALPVLLWNESRGWPSVRLHLVERAAVAVPVAGENTVNRLVEISSTSGEGLLGSVLRVLVGQLMAYSPLLAPLVVLGLARSLRRARIDDRDLFVSAFTWPALLPLLAAMTAFKDAEQHWTMTALVPAVIAAGRWADVDWSGAKLVRRMTAVGFALSAVGFIAVNVHVRSTALLRLIPSAHYDPRADIVNELVGWKRVRASLTRAAAAVPGAVVLASNHYSLCGRLFFEMGDEPAVYCPTGRRSAYDYFGRHDVPDDATVVALTTDIREELPAGLRDRACALADEVDVERGDRRVARYFVHTCAPRLSRSDARASR
ncbi:MAG TPA: glycosyltransferase family 39 protein [Polyangiaceae bacterium]|nr:glycosyltransferase family 39 protein [Polyangiaceae bacterium]